MPWGSSGGVALGLGGLIGLLPDRVSPTRRGQGSVRRPNTGGPTLADAGAAHIFLVYRTIWMFSLSLANVHPKKLQTETEAWATADPFLNACPEP